MIKYWLIIFHKDQIATINNQILIKHDQWKLLDIEDLCKIGEHEGLPVFTLSLDEEIIDPPFSFVPLRSYFDSTPSDLLPLGLRAKHLARWNANSKFCGHCGHTLQFKTTEIAKECLQCGLIIYPHFSPAVSVLIIHGRRLLLGRSPHFRSGMYSAIAGFIEPGESAEETVKREVAEEVGVKVKNIRYVGSQSWPFPDTFMLGFFADYESGELTVDKNELEDAQWFDRDNLPELPSPFSISGQLIRKFLES